MLTTREKKDRLLRLEREGKRLEREGRVVDWRKYNRDMKTNLPRIILQIQLG
jgi:hypothetical protein